MNTKDTADITKTLCDELGVSATTIKEWRGSTGSTQDILHDIMKLPDKGKILVLVDKTMWHCWLVPCVFGATETLHYDRAYATGKYSALHETRHLFGARDLI